MSLRSDVHRARTAFWWVGVIVPLVLLVLSAAIVLAWLPELPDPVAMHWGTDGVDGFGPRWTVFGPLLVGAGLVALFAALALFAHRMPQSLLSGGGGVVADEDGRPQWSMTARGLGAVSLGEAGLMAVLTVVTADVQRGLTDAADAPDIGWWVLIGFVVLVALAVTGWFLQPKVAPPAPVATTADAVPLTPSERAAWLGTVSIAPAGRITLGILWLVLAGATVFTLAQGDAGGAGWILIATTMLTLVAVGSALVFRVRVSNGGLRVRSVAGWPNTRIPLSDIARVEVVQINPLAEFGGWGWRLGMDGRRGVVLRTGEALQVTRQGGKVFVVTVDGAAEAGAVLEGLRAARLAESER
jgi:hypothetical protein